MLLSKKTLTKAAGLFLGAALLAPTAPATAAPLTDEERQYLLDHLERTQAFLLKTLEGVSDEQWSYKPAEDRWSIAQTMEHIVLSEAFIRDAVVKLMETPATEEQKAAGGGKEDQVLNFIVDRSQKFQAPDPLAPPAELGNLKEAQKRFKKERAKTRKLAKKGGDLRNFVGPHPAFKDLDAYGWMLFLSGHTERHIQQIREIQSGPGYPES